MKRIILYPSLLILAICTVSMFKSTAQTAGTLTFSVTTTSTGNYSPKNVFALWLETASGSFVKTKMRYGVAREHDLVLWLQKSGGNVVDATTGATLNSHGTRTISWNGTDINGNLVPDGDYKVWMEMAWYNTPPAGPNNNVTFTKAGSTVHLTPTNTTNFLSQVLDWVPESPPVITTSPIGGNSFCVGAMIPVSFTVNSGIIYPNNTFTSQLSDANGSFFAPVNIGMINGATPAVINSIIPTNTPPGTGYRIRVISSQPAAIGSDNGTDLTINTGVIPSISISASSQEICTGTEVTFYATPVNGGSSPTYQWTVNGSNVGPNSPTYSSTTLANGDIINCILTSSDPCAINPNATSNSIAMVVYTPAAVTISLQNDTLYSSAAIGNQWYNSLGMIPGATGDYYVPLATNTYYSIVTDLNNCISQSNNIYYEITTIEEAAALASKVFPNPFESSIFVILKQNVFHDIQVLVHDPYGRVLKRLAYANKNSLQCELDLSDLPSGVFTLELISGSIHQTLRIVKLK